MENLISGEGVRVLRRGARTYLLTGWRREVAELEAIAATFDDPGWPAKWWVEIELIVRKDSFVDCQRNLQAKFNTFSSLLLTFIALGAFVVPTRATESIRFRVSLEFERGHEVVVGAGVVELSVSDTRGLLGSMGGVGSSVRGEAVLVNLGGGQIVLALLRGPRRGLGSIDGLGDVLQKACKDVLIGERDSLQQIRMLRRLRPRRDVSFEDLPMLVHFRNPSDPRSVEQVDSKNVSAILGNEVRLRAAHVEVVDEPISFKLRDKLPWLGTLTTQLDGRKNRDSKTLANELNVYDFERGRK